MSDPRFPAVPGESEERAAARPDCEHHWVAHFQPDIPAILGWVSICSLCGDVNGAELCARLGRPRHSSTEVLERIAYWTRIGAVSP